MGRTKQEVLTEFRCSEILEAARHVFARRGFSGATVDDIAEASGIAKGTLYLYFPSKREIYLAALKQGVRALNQDIRMKMEAARTMRDKIRVFIETRVLYYEQNRDFFKIYHSEVANVLVHPVHHGKDFREIYLEQARMLDAALAGGAKVKKIRSIRTDTAAFTICDMTRGLIVQRLLGWSKAEVEDDIQFLFDLVWRGIGS